MHYFMRVFFARPLSLGTWHRLRRRLAWQAWRHGMKHSVHSKEVELPYILNFLTYGGAIRRGGPKLAVVHDSPERITITLPAAWPAARPRAETAYTAPPVFSPPQRRVAAFLYVRKKKADTNRVAKSGQIRWRLTFVYY